MKTKNKDYGTKSVYLKGEDFEGKKLELQKIAGNKFYNVSISFIYLTAFILLGVSLSAVLAFFIK